MGENKKHPPGLYFLFFTEMWERFGFYLMLGIFTLYMIEPPNTSDPAKGGLGLSAKDAADIFGTYVALVYLTPFLGGLLADRYIGYRLSIFIGGALMAVGYLGLAWPGWTAFWGSLLLIILGNGLFKPNISTLLGNLYSDDRYKPYKDAGYNIFYMGINIGAFICNFVAAYLRTQYGWGYAFAAGGVGMLIGLTVFAFGQGKVRAGDVRKPARPEDMPMRNIIGTVFAPAAVFGVIGWFLPSQNWLLGHPILSKSTDAFLFACIPVLAFYVSLWLRAHHEDRRAVGALLAIFGVVIVFWAIFNQAGTALTFWAERYTNRTLPTALAPAAEDLGMVQKVDGKLEKRPKLDAQFREEPGPDGKPIEGMEHNPYLLNLPKDEWPKGDETLRLIPAEIFQSINPFWVVALTPVVVGFFGFLKRRGAEPSTPAKIAYGPTIAALASLVMVAAVYATQNGQYKASAWWLVNGYFVMTVAELCLSPMGLSLVSKLSPVRLTALMMGGWFLSTSIGGKLSGVLASMWDGYENKANFFYMNIALSLGAAVVLFLMVPWLRGVVKEKTGAD